MISMIFKKGVSQGILSISPVIGETQRGHDNDFKSFVF